MKPLIVLVFFIAWMFILASAFARDEQFEKVTCDAEFIATQIQAMSYDGLQGLINYWEEIGAIEAKHAQELRSLAKEAHIAYGNQQLGREPDALLYWVRKKCHAK
ncbi:MAG: hypothetical protein MN733_13790 [Nitrososphaera sp.]|nr:hypothetical protein [Nitrososphaera sp.]